MCEVRGVKPKKKCRVLGLGQELLDRSELVVLHQRERDLAHRRGEIRVALEERDDLLGKCTRVSDTLATNDRHGRLPSRPSAANASRARARLLIFSATRNAPRT
jgi:hypothetical protein